MKQSKIRNIAIIAHVDHGKTTLVDALFQQSGMFHDRQSVSELLMDSMDQERERGITISSKNGSFEYEDHLINIIDTPGHADFGGQVERVLKMADGAVLLVDAQEGPMPQTYFVLKKALALNLPILVVINKMDKPAARPDWVLNEVFDLFVKLGAPDDILDFEVVYGSAKEGHMSNNPEVPGKTLKPLYDKILTAIPSPSGNPIGPLQFLVSSLDYSPYLGRMGIGKITNGSMNINEDIVVALRDGKLIPARISKMYKFVGNAKVETDIAEVGDIVAVAGMNEVTVGVTYTDPVNPIPLPPMQIDPPTLSMNFIPNDSPFAGQDGKFVTSTQLKERLEREILSDVALHIEELKTEVGHTVSGRGELHLSILIESMRREGYEFQVTRPRVIYKEIDGKTQEPYEELTVDVDERFSGAVIEKLGSRKGQMISMNQAEGMVRLVYAIPTRGLLGYQAEFMTDTKGMGMMSCIFDKYGPFSGEIINRKLGVLVSMSSGQTVAYALFNLKNRGRMFMPAGVKIYTGQIIGEHCREGDLKINPTKSKQLSNMRSSGADEATTVAPHTEMRLEDKISFINDDELVEVTPKEIRLRKRKLS